jgi:hypothetical protein
MNDRLSEAVAVYFSHGLPGEYGNELLAAHYREAELPGLQRDVDELIDRSLAIGREFRHVERPAAMEAVMEALRREHPELSEEAIQALGRNWAFCNR